MTAGRVLVVDDDRDMCELVAAALRGRGFDVEWTTSATDALERVHDDAVDAVVTDLEMSGMNGLELCARVRADRPGIPVAMLSGFDDFKTAVAALRAGACDFVTKPPQIDALAGAVERAVRSRALHEELKRLPGKTGKIRGFDDILGHSSNVQHMVELLERIVDSDVSVLIAGESGTGKELVARALHRRGRRSSGPFVAVNCAAVPEALLESELFGHVRGAFTDAREDRAGLFVQAHGGTLFLDEIADLPVHLQPKLLRALQERRVRPVGGDREVPCDVRVVTATNRSLIDAVRDGHFREDLFFRINVLQVDVPPLRARGRDVLLLGQHFLERYAAQADKAVTGFSPPAAERLLAYDWPGNVRELQNCVERAVALALHDLIGVDDLPDRIRACQRQAPLPLRDTPADLSLRELEHRHILQVLAATGGNRRAAARTLGVDRKTLSRKLSRFAATD